MSVEKVKKFLSVFACALIAWALIVSVGSPSFKPDGYILIREPLSSTAMFLAMAISFYYAKRENNA